ncbi:hypothetical protein EUX98_g2087 [Antrodiella citrinella]|uniref:NADP-dependent oxidoreductase domain-containing protein n=1 Tax=Antrodiella citrinella TaxID=2447956 RepID=A0A4V3XJ82_9APHY|nr:hypothetical protein EUX98_g2087 [Antrodiella citrinella]
MSDWAQPPHPKTKLGRYRQFAPLAGVHLSPIAFGGMSIGDKGQQHGVHTMGKEQSFELLDAYYGAGGNFIDTSNNYQDETSEAFIGEWMEKRDNRQQMFVATKYTTNFKMGKGPEFGQKVMYTGNNVKAMNTSVDESLKKLRTHYIDLLYVHWWDYATGIEEVMNGLHNLVTQGKVLYLGISDSPAWIVSAANTYARLTGKTPFVVYQGAWSVLSRDFEREIIPMARQQGRMLLTDSWERNEDERKMCKALEEVAKEVGTKSITAVAIAYVMQKVPYVFPIIGGHKVEHLYSNLEALDIALTAEHIRFIESVLPFDPGFPYGPFFGSAIDSDYNILVKTAGHFDKWPLQQAIRPAPIN